MEFALNDKAKGFNDSQEIIFCNFKIGSWCVCCGLREKFQPL